MNQVFDTQAPKKPANVSINSDLLTKAKELSIYQQRLKVPSWN
jgi:antitoxin CcdA